MRILAAIISLFGVWTVFSAVETIGIRHILGMGLFFMYAEVPVEAEAAG